MRADVDFDDLVRQQYEPLYRFALSLTRHESDACDLTQDTFHVWATKGGQLHDPAKVKAWLFTTLHRRFLQTQRRRTRFPHYDLEEVVEELPVIDPVLISRLEGLELVEMLGRVDPQFQAAVALFYLEEYSYQEIGEVLQIPLGTVKSRIARGLAQLRVLIHNQLTRGASPPPEL